MMTLGILGDGTTAMLTAGLTIYGLQAGSLFMTEQPDLVMLIFAYVVVTAIVTYHIRSAQKPMPAVETGWGISYRRAV